MRVPQNWGYRVGGPLIRATAFWGLYWGTPILGNFHMEAV